jgi:hypothetical protein
MSWEDVTEFSPVCDSLDVPWVAADNRPVSIKWQRGLEFLRGAMPDANAVMLMGSDDFASPAWWHYCSRMIVAKAERAFGTHRVWMIDAETCEMGLFIASCERSMGVGRVFPRAYLERAEWILWDQEADKGLDHMCADRLSRLDLPILPAHGAPGIIVDVKTQENIHSFSEFATWLGLPLSKFDVLLEPIEAQKVLAGHGMLDDMFPIFERKGHPKWTAS